MELRTWPGRLPALWELAFGWPGAAARTISRDVIGHLPASTRAMRPPPSDYMRAYSRHAIRGPTFRQTSHARKSSTPQRSYTTGTLGDKLRMSLWCVSLYLSPYVAFAARHRTLYPDCNGPAARS